MNLDDFSLLADETPLPSTSKRKSIHDEPPRARLTTAPLIPSSSSESNSRSTTFTHIRQPAAKERLEPEPVADEETVILEKPPQNLPPPRSPSPTNRKPEPLVVRTSEAVVEEKLPPEPTTPRQQTGIIPATPGTLSRSKVRITDETERIVVCPCCLCYDYTLI